MIEKLKNDIDNLLNNKNKIRENKLKRILGEPIEKNVLPINNFQERERINSQITDLCNNFNFEDFRVVIDESNNSEYTIDNDMLIIDVYVKPINTGVKVLNVYIKNNMILS